jgi:hypothetical protein
MNSIIEDVIELDIFCLYGKIKVVGYEIGFVGWRFG